MNENNRLGDEQMWSVGMVGMMREMKVEFSFLGERCFD